MVNKETFIRNLKNEIAEHPFFPIILIEYLENVVDRNAEETLLPALLSIKNKVYLQNINILFESACKACELDIDNFVTLLEIKPRDTKYGRIDAMFAILRVINELSNWGFSNIKPIKTSNKPRADIYCEYLGCHCIVEVFCSLGKYHRYPDQEKNALNLGKYFISRAQEKKKQIDETANDYSCEKKIIAMVLNSPKACALLVHEEFKEFLTIMSNSLNWGPEYHYILITGQKEAFTGIMDDVIYPPI
jgi:hypothetical protein